MLYLVFQIGAERYALPVVSIAEVLPLVESRPLPQSLPGIAGIFSYHGTPVPLVDLCALLLNRAARPRMSTRIILVRYPAGPDEFSLLGLLAENITETIRRGKSDFVSTGVHVEKTPYLGPVTRDSRGLIQRVELQELLPESVRSVLFPAMEVTAP